MQPTDERPGVFKHSNPHHQSPHTIPITLREHLLLNMGLENDKDLKRMREELKKEKERVARLEKEVKERMRRDAEQKKERLRMEALRKMR